MSKRQLDPKAEWVQRVLGVSLSLALDGADDAAQDGAPSETAVRDRLQTLGATLRGSATLAANPGLKSRFAEALGKFRAGDMAQANAMLDDLSEELGTVGGDAEAQALWQQAITSVMADLGGFRKALLRDAAVTSDPRLRFVAAAASEIPNMLPPGWRKLSATLKGGGGAQGARKAVTAYRAALSSATRLARLEDFARKTLSYPLAVRETLTAALDDIASSLDAVA